jgi:hypothetical protein
MANLRKEIAELEERKERAERRSRAAASGRPSSFLPREDDERDDPSPPSSIGRGNGVPDSRSGFLVAAPTVLEASPVTETAPQSEMNSGVSREIQNDLIPEVLSSFSPIRKLVLVSNRVLRRIMAAKESLVKFGTFVPRNDREANLSPEAARWKAARDLEWFRLHKEGTFDGDWTWDKVCEAYPNYKRSDVGFLFYVYDFKFSGEHRVRLVFDGSRQGKSTYKETYAPTVRAESVRLFTFSASRKGFISGNMTCRRLF